MPDAAGDALDLHRTRFCSSGGHFDLASDYGSSALMRGSTIAVASS